MSQRPRHRYAADLPRGLPGRHLRTLPGVPAATVNSGTRRARPISTRFEPVSELKDVTTPVPRVLLSATLAGPAPSGSTDTSRLCQGCSRPPRHHPDQAALSYTALLRQDGGEGLSPPLEPQRLTAQTDDLTSSARFASGRAVVKHAGLNPSERTSATINGQTRISRRGLPGLRSAAWRAVWGALRHNKVLMAKHARRRAGTTTGSPAGRPAPRARPPCCAGCGP